MKPCEESMKNFKYQYVGVTRQPATLVDVLANIVGDDGVEHCDLDFFAILVRGDLYSHDRIPISLKALGHAQ